jgi:hypothetical protein
MTDVAWRVEARRLLPVVRATESEVRALGADAWIAREAGRLRAPGVAVRWASGPQHLGLGPFAGLEDQASWLVDPDADARRDLFRVVLGAGGAVLRADARPGDEPRRPIAVGGAADDGTERLVVLDGDELLVSARASADASTTVTVRAAWGDDDLWSLEVLVERTDGAGLVRRRALAHPASSGLGTSHWSRTDRLVRGPAGAPAEWWDDAPQDADGDEPGEQLIEDAPDEVVAGAGPGGGDADRSAGAPDDEGRAGEGSNLDALLGVAFDLLRPDDPPPTPRLRWSARVHGAPPPVPPVTDAAARAGAEAMLGTILRAAASSGVAEPCALHLDHGWGDGMGDPALPELVVVSRDYRDRFLALPAQRSGAHLLRESVDAGGGVRIPLDHHADDATLAHWLPLRRAGYGLPGTTEDDRERAGELLRATRRRLLTALMEHDFGPAWAAPVLPWLIIGEGERSHEVRPWDELRELATPEAFAALQAAWPSRATAEQRPQDVPGGDAARRDDEGSGSSEDAAVEAARRSRAGLLRLLEREGLGDHAAPLAVAARPGFVLEPAPDDAPPPFSRVAGPALLPPGAPWPTTPDGDPLTFVAAIALAELPPTDDPHPLPADGVLLIYVLIGDPDPDEGMLAFVEAEEDGATVFHVPAGVAPVAATGPPVGVLRRGSLYEEPLAIAERPPGAAGPGGGRPRVQAGRDYDVADRFGLHPSEAERYDHVIWGLLPEGESDDGWGDEVEPDDGDWSDEVDWEDDEADEREVVVLFGNIDDLRAGGDGDGDRDDADEHDLRPDRGPAVSGTLLGTEPGVQGVPLGDAEIVLLALAGTPELGLEWGDGGDLRVLIDAADLAAGRWDRARATGDCC